MIDRLRALGRNKFVRDTLVLQWVKIVNTTLGMIALLLTVRLLGFEQYGVWKLVLAFFAIWQAFEMTGVGMSTSTRLSLAVGRKDGGAVLDLLAFYVKINLLWAALCTVLMFLLGPALAEQMYGSARIGWLAAIFSFTGGADSLYNLVILALQTRRLMPELARLQNLNQLVLFGLTVSAVLISPTVEALLIARLLYSFSTFGLAWTFYRRMANAGPLAYPPFGEVVRRALTVPIRSHWRSGVAMALDKNISNLYPQVPVTMVGLLQGETAAGFLGTALDFIGRSGVLTGPLMDNMQAVVPQAVGRGNFAALKRDFGRVVLVLGAIGIGFYALIALITPLILPLILQDAQHTLGPIMVLTLYGVTTAVGGVFGPLYRAFGMLRQALVAKIAAVVVMLPLGMWLIQTWGATGGAWTIVGLFAISVALTMAFTVPELNRRAAAQEKEKLPTPSNSSL